MCALPISLNKGRAAGESKGLIRWLRPEFQAPDYKAPVTQTLDLGETAAVLPENVIPWPGSLPEQVSAVQSILSAAGSPLAPQDVARAFKRSEEHTSELQSLMRISYAVFCLKKKTNPSH